MQSRRYLVYDVFADRALAGNPLAVVLDCDGMDTTAMQAVAREFNLSETVFILPPLDRRHRARVRIFTPEYEMPFAGHPTVGSAVALAEMESGDRSDAIFVLEENIGAVRCAVRRDNGAIFAEFDLPQLPVEEELSADPEAFGAALGLGPHEIGFENHRVSAWSAGVPYIAVPVRDLRTAAKARLDNETWMDLLPGRSGSAVAAAYVYTRETVHHDSAFHARMFSPGNPSFEDPATGSAAAAFAGAIVHFDRPNSGMSRFWIEQGLEMGRPSRIRLELDIEKGRLAAGRVGGHAVKVAQGTLFA